MGAVLSGVARKAADQVKVVGRVAKAVKVVRVAMDKTAIKVKKCITGSLHL
jgi:alanine racemase